MTKHLAACAGILLCLSGCSAAQSFDQSEPRFSSVAASTPAALPADNKDESTAPVLTSTKSDPAAAQAAARSVVYSASFHLVVADVTRTLDSIQSTAEQLGGYLQEMNATGITFRVPVAKFDAAVAAVGKFGEVTDRQIKAADITEEMHDLNIRLENAELMRQRLLKILEGAGKMDDTLKVEQELQRVTEQVELLKGKIRFMQSQAAMSTIQVVVNSPLPQRAEPAAAMPFAWVRELGSGATSGFASAQPRKGGWFDKGTRFDLPKGFIRYVDSDESVEAMNADGVILKLQRHDNYDGGDTFFWAPLARKTLVESRSLAVDTESDLRLKTGNTAKLIIGTKARVDGPQHYMICVAASHDHVFTFEAWGEAKAFDAAKSSIQAAAETLDIGK